MDDDDNNDDDNQLNNATFEQDGTFTCSASVRPSDSSEDKPKTQSPVDTKRTGQDEQSTPQTEPTTVQPVAPEPLGPSRFSFFHSNVFSVFSHTIEICCSVMG